uniref:Vitellogenin domain-containing protein n=1 Tax=Heterorhabditis bacteriophora TaxID=37862 RepID=A0A1I7WEY7_HETBA
MKIDADIVVIDAIEALSLRIPLDSKWGFQLESRTHIEITNRTVHYVNRHCTVDLSVAQCAQQNFKATRVGHKLFENVVIGSRDVQNKLASVIEKYRVHLLDMGDSHLCEKHSSMFATIIQEAHRATEDEWRYLIRNPDNEAILISFIYIFNFKKHIYIYNTYSFTAKYCRSKLCHCYFSPVIANVLGSMGSSSSLQVAREILFVEGPEFIDQYLFGAAHAISHDEKWHKKMMYWLADSQSHPALYWRIANTIATILMRRCESSPSNWNSCNNNKEKIVSKFITDVSNCSNNECHKNALEIFINIPITATYQYARRFVCSSSPRELQMAALYVIKATSNKLYDSQLVKSLINVFRNVCPVPTTTGESQLAVDILLRCILDQQNVATMLLRSESLHPDNHEKWQYFYKAVAASAVEDELVSYLNYITSPSTFIIYFQLQKEELWSRMRKFKVFRPNYAQRSLIASSTSHWREIEETSNYKLNSISSMEFSSGIFKRSEFSTRMKKGKKEDEIFALTIFTEGLDSYLTESEVVQVDPYATIRLSLFGHALPTTTLFTGNSELMAAVWNSNGQTIKGFEV